ncbi:MULTISPECIES: DinB family protein [Paenibacillus]|uniref:DinB family protein n=1 Tax=Paenibacillus TaxID=44249 RepID=UPI0022B8FF92|nr:DUF1572 family protein [Paenibacillus caseinilyticus]MCZ8521782.1 DUF1572 family protein [Paenibacillus caseinilyticus]
MNLPVIIQNEMNKQLQRIETCVSLLSEEQIWNKFKPSMNSIGNLCLHLAGNEYQHLVSGMGGMPFVRTRTREFTENNGRSGNELLELLHNVRLQSSQVLEHLSETSLEKVVSIHYSSDDWNSMVARPRFEEQSYYSKTIETILIQVCEHYSYHTGQIVILTKLLNENPHPITGTSH